MKAVQGSAHLLKYFSRDSDYQVVDSIKQMVKFENTICWDRFGDFELILCRNVAIYLPKKPRRNFLQVCQALAKDRVCLCKQEQIFQARELNLKSIATFFIKKSVSGLNGREI